MSEERADLILLNGKIITVDPQDTIAEAVAIKGNKILCVGSTQDVKERISKDARVVDLRGRVVLPGFVDAHTHPEMFVESSMFYLQIHAPPMKSVKDILGKVRKRAQEIPEGDWIVGRGCLLLERKLVEKRYPTKAELDEAAPNHPVALMGGAHVTIVNSKALEKAGITRDTPTLVKQLGHTSVIKKDPVTGEPTGELGEALELLDLPKPSFEQLKTQFLKVLVSQFIQKGVTTIYAAGLHSSEGIRALQHWMQNGELPLRIRFYHLVRDSEGTEAVARLGLQNGFGNEWMKFGGLKLFMDGGFTAPRAALYQPYPHDVNDFGLLLHSQESLNQIYLKAHKAGLQVITHTAGERSQDMVLNAIEACIHEFPGKDHRHRLEHAGNNFATEERIERMVKLGAIPVTEPQLLHAAGFLMEQLYGERVKKNLWPHRRLLDMGVKLPFSSDITGTQPEGLNPFWGIWCAVTRQSYDGSLVNPDQKISALEAIRCYTINSAYAGFEENTKGSIECGKLADLIVLSDDPLTVDPDKIRDIKIKMTIIDGKMVYEAPS